jgi:hypothetical protein
MRIFGCYGDDLRQVKQICRVLSLMNKRRSVSQPALNV